MTNEKLPKEYTAWIEMEKRESAEAFEKFRTRKSHLNNLRFKSSGSSHQASGFSHQASGLRLKAIRKIVAAAVIVLAVGLSLWFSRDKIFNSTPKYTQEQIALSYEHTIKALYVYSTKLNESFDKLQNLSNNLPPKPIHVPTNK